MVDVAEVQFASDLPIDKIVAEGEVEIYNDGNTVWYFESKVESDSVPHGYGRAGLVRARWSIDGGANWNPPESQIIYYYTQSTISGEPGHPTTTRHANTDSAVSVGADDTHVHFRTANGKHGNVTGIVTPSYTPTPRTFLIQWWMYERE